MRGVTSVLCCFEFIKSFQLTRLMRGVTVPLEVKILMTQFQLTRLMRGVTVYQHLYESKEKDFNSHASCEA